jgi:hypothetical protein
MRVTIFMIGMSIRDSTPSLYPFIEQLNSLFENNYCRSEMPSLLDPIYYSLDNFL